ncbi:hypothetical protein [Saccharothrix yanglingensis]|uniref:Uncharacterized protein n=1 Tax=Saccharothrix yanglingensis TaxID=659496 RepID=A0ABU0XA73_9PSEU|nr:hypothetical protein [Saccharothrix yanglingensis]MDQ2588104.1 hypothetical protein [Saccharothrix yanglingensis]
MSALLLASPVDAEELPARLRWEAAKALRNAPEAPATPADPDEAPTDRWWMADNGLIDARPDDEFRAGAVPQVTPVLRHP